MKLLERSQYLQRANSLCVGDSAGSLIAWNLTLNGHYYWLEEQLSAGHFGTDLNHSGCTTSVADGAHSLTCMIEGLQDFCDRLVGPQKQAFRGHLELDPSAKKRLPCSIYGCR